MRCLWGLMFLVFNLYAYDINKVGIINRDDFPFQIEDNKSFDIASRFEILNYVKQISKINVNENQFKEFFQKDYLDLESINRWLIFTKELLTKNYKISLKTCILGNLNEMCIDVKNWEELEYLANNNSNKLLFDWSNLNEMFYKNYLYEQMRLSSLSKKITSEIFTLDDKEEQGFSFEDREFLITFDDGPFLPNSERISEKLNNLEINAIFFVLGENFERFLKKKDEKNQKIYKNMCVGSHGYVHKPFPKLINWSDDYDKTKALILDSDLQGYKAKKIYFRPPYGQRQNELVKKVIDEKDKLLLWNIDSQDWNKKLSEKQVYDRVFSLMLLYRKGVILFHDTNMKGIFAVENIYNNKKRREFIKFIDCKGIIEK